MGDEFLFAPPFYALRLGGVAAFFLLASWFAWRRVRAGEPESRLRGILLSAVAALLGFIFYVGGLAALAAPVLLLYFSFYVVILIGLPALGSSLLADVIFRLLGAQRTRFWLAASVIFGVAISFVWVRLLLGGGLPFDGMPVLEYAGFSLAPASAAIIWWSYLPGGGDGAEIAEAFE